jgi:hypothetical protein
MGLVFCHLRLAEVTIPRTEKDDAATITALKAQKYLQGIGMHSGTLAGDLQHICFGTQTRFTAGLTPQEIGKRLAVAIPFIINDPEDITATTKWLELRAHGRVLLARLEAELAVCRTSGLEHAMGHSIFRLIQKLLKQFLDLRALALLPLMATDPTAPYAAEITAIAGGYIDQANMWPECLRVATDMIDGDIFTGYGGNPALSSNAAHTAMARPFLLALLHGMARPRTTDRMLLEHAEISAGPIPWVFNRPDGLPGPLGPPGPPGPPPGQRPNPAPKPTPAPLAPRPAPPGGMPSGPERGPPAGVHGTLWDAVGRPGFRTDTAGYLYHPSWYSGEYACPFGWAPPPGAPGFREVRETGARDPGVTRSSLTIPVAISIVASSSPFQSPPKEPCRYCNMTGHAQYECPKRFADTYHEPLPGFLVSGAPDPSAWLGGSLLAPARAAMAAYVRKHNIPPHRKYPVTAEHIASGSPPAIQL